MSDTNKQLIVVTGGTKGIGRAILERFAAAGYTLATCARNETDLLTLKQELEDRFQINLYTFKADVSNKNEVANFIEFVKSINLPISVLVNNAGKFLPGAIHEEADGVLESQIQTNLYSAYWMSKGLVSVMKNQGFGHVFNMCSIASITAYSNGGSYCISKFAMYGMSKVLREEMKPFKIRVTSVLPGATLTDSWAGVDLPEERFIKPEDVAEMVYSTYQLSDRTVIEDLVIRPQLGDL